MLEEPLGLEAPDRVAHRRAAHVELLRDRHFHDSVAGLEHAAPQRVAQLLIRVPAARAVADGCVLHSCGGAGPLEFHVRYYNVFPCIHAHA